jgi:glyoxylase-like metal-dependent hydrolase (beta-lactamase superfamily II)
MQTPPVHRIRIANPYFEGSNNAWLIAGEIPTLIDTAIGTPASWDALVAGLAEHAYAVGDIKRVVLTHKHFDHAGLVWKIIEANRGVEILAHREDVEEIEKLDERIDRFSSSKTDRLRGWGVPDAELRAYTGYAIPPEWDMRPFSPRGIEGGAVLDLGGGSGLEVIHTPGHTMGSICLKLGRYLFCGDHVLPNLSPNIGGGDLDKRGLLGAYLNSLDRVASLQREDLLVMPGHGAPFTRLAERCASIASHHAQRLDRIAEMLKGGKKLSVYQIAHGLFGEMKSIHLLLGCAEAHAHLEYLRGQHRVEALLNGRWGGA